MDEALLVADGPGAGAGRPCRGRGSWWLTGAGAAAADGATKPPLVTEGGGEHAAAVTEQQRHGEHTWKRGGEK